MKLKDGFITHTMGEEQIMVQAGCGSFAGMVRSNKTAAYMVECLKKETSREQIIEKMMEKYDAPKEVISRDVDKILDILRGIGALCE